MNQIFLFGLLQQDCEEGECGYLICRGGNVLLGYLNPLESRKKKMEFKNGNKIENELQNGVITPEKWYLGFGDVGFFLKNPKDGGRDFYWVTRTADLLIKGGVNYSCSQINSVLFEFLIKSFNLSEKIQKRIQIAAVGVKWRSEHDDDNCVTVEFADSDFETSEKEKQFESKKGNSEKEKEFEKENGSKREKETQKDPEMSPETEFQEVEFKFEEEAAGKQKKESKDEQEFQYEKEFKNEKELNNKKELNKKELKEEKELKRGTGKEGEVAKEMELLNRQQQQQKASDLTGIKEELKELNEFNEIKKEIKSKFLEKAKESKEIQKGFKPDFVRFAKIPRTFKGSVDFKKLKEEFLIHLKQNEVKSKRQNFVSDAIA